jgi:hypothetical protein
VVDYFHLTAGELDEPVAGEPGVGPIPTGATPDFKLVTATVAWLDEAGSTNQINLETIIDSYPPALTSLSGTMGVGGVSPRARYNPESAPDVIDISVDTGQGKFRQTSKPLPDVVKTGQNENTIVSFEVMTYHADSGEYIADRQEEFITVDCNCRLSADADIAMTPAHVRWDEGSSTRFDVQGQSISKQTAEQVNNSNAVAALCSVCCRDHHDDDASPVKYVPGTTGGNHTHYKADGSVADVGDVYRESCRMKRVDGVMRVFQDWDLRDITILDRLQLFDGQTLQTQYQEYVEDLILFEVAGVGSPVKPALRSPVETNTGVQQQLESRGVYIDRVYDDLGNNDPASYVAYIADAGNVDRLEKVPFAEVNLTLLSDWLSASPTFVSVASEPVATIADPVNNYYGTYRRGWIHALQETAGVEIETTMRSNNDGLTQLKTTPLVAEADDAILVSVGPPGDEITISGTYAITYPLGNTSASTAIHLTPVGSGSCSLPGTPGNTYVCSVNSPWAGSIQIKTAVTTGNPNQRCTGQSTEFIGSPPGLVASTTWDFASFACTQ